jgi:hypothetical protein
MKALIIIAIVALAHHADAKGCHESSDVVGYHHCSRFGYLWSRESDSPRFMFELGYFYHRFTANSLNLGDAPLVMQGTAPDMRTSAAGASMRFIGGLNHVLYTGLELDAGGNDILPKPFGAQPTDGLYMSPMLVFGAHVIERYRVALSAELAGGFRYDDFFSCPESMPKCTGPDDSQTRRQVEARARAEFFIHPHVTAVLTYGVSLIDSGDRMWMLGFGIHGRTMDGMY